MQLHANLIDIHEREIYPAYIYIKNGCIEPIEKSDEKSYQYILLGFIDAHVHIESSMVTPVAFSREAVKHGTVGIVSDPHEIANVLGEKGVQYMVKNARQTPLKILFGAPSCVPATTFESSGAVIDEDSISRMLKIPEIGFLSEVMNYPGVIHADELVMKKMRVAQLNGVPVDGHAPGLMGEDLKKYAAAGISTDHECYSIEEAKEKIQQGMYILIREGSGAKNYHALAPLLKLFPEKVMFCTDDLHPDDLVNGHINLLVKRALREGYDLFDTLRAASLHAVQHYQLDVGLLRPGDPADFIIVDSLEDFQVLSTYIDGIPVFRDGREHIPEVETNVVNKFDITEINEIDIRIRPEASRMNVIQAIDGELITRRIIRDVKIEREEAISDVENDVLKIVVVNRYEKTPPAVGFISGFQLKKGALVSTIAHDSHNIICLGTNDQYITETINWAIRYKGGIAVHDGKKIHGLPLEIAGIMTTSSVQHAAEK